MNDKDINNFELEFDSCGSLERNYIEYKTDYELNDEETIRVYVDGEKELKISTYRDLWGTYITFKMGENGITIAQEDGTRSFMDGFLFCLNKLKNITDIKTTPPTTILKD